MHTCNVMFGVANYAAIQTLQCDSNRGQYPSIGVPERMLLKQVLCYATSVEQRHNRLNPFNISMTLTKMCI